MKKLVCIAIFSFAIAANATEKNEIVIGSDEKEVVTNNSTEINFEFNDFDVKISEYEMVFGCGSDGNDLYDRDVASGSTHRQARERRRAFVRRCRGFGEGGWVVDVLTTINDLFD